jgi:hypothetical protein
VFNDTFNNISVISWRSDLLVEEYSEKPIDLPSFRGLVPSFVNYKKGALDSQPQVIELTSCLPMVGGSLRVLRLPPSLKLVAMIYI